MLPRIPKVSTADDFRAFVAAGRELATLHIGYEAVEPYPLTDQRETVGGRRRKPSCSITTAWRRCGSAARVRPGPFDHHLQLADHRLRHPATRPTSTCSGPGPRSSGSSSATRLRPTRHRASSTTRTTGPVRWRPALHPRPARPCRHRQHGNRPYRPLIATSQRYARKLDRAEGH